MLSIRKLASWVWLVGFRIGCLGCIVIGVLVVIGFALALVLRLIRPASVPDMPELMSAFAAAMAILIAMVGVKGLRVKSTVDIAREVDALAARRDSFERWINK